MPDPVSTWADAKIVAWEHLVKDWPADELGPVQIAPNGWETPKTWGVTVTNPVADGVYLTVFKANGEVAELNWAEWIDGYTRRATKVGDWSEVPA